MGLFSFLFGKRDSRVDLAEDRIWMTTAAKYNGIERDVGAMQPQGTTGILLLAHFPDVLVEIDRIADNPPTPVPVRSCLACDLTASLISDWPLNDTSTVVIICAERHPLRDRDDAVLDFATSLPGTVRLVRHTSLHDPLVRAFAGSAVETMLRSMGMDENEAIESRMVGRRITAAQEKLAQKQFGNSTAGSAEDWIRTNVPDLDFDR